VRRNSKKDKTHLYNRITSSVQMRLIDDRKSCEHTRLCVNRVDFQSEREAQHNAPRPILCVHMWHLLCAACVCSLKMQLIRPEGRNEASEATAVLVRAAASETEQHHLFHSLCTAVQGTKEWSQLQRREPVPLARPVPFCVWRHPYTQQTNVLHKPELIFDWAHSLAQRVAEELRRAGGCKHTALANLVDAVKFDSLLTVLYPPGGTLQPHIDKGLHGCGLAVSLGSACTFDYGGTEIVLTSGDALFADFGLVQHAVQCTHAYHTAPPWWRDLHLQRADSMSTFGRARCSVQLRDRAWSRRPHPTDPTKAVQRRVRVIDS
jgi:alkylated DNA repair dioxygenase AlkB